MLPLYLDRTANQRFSVCLAEIPILDPATATRFTNGTCLTYPGEALRRFDSTVAQLLSVTLGLSFLFDVSPHLPSDQWVPLRLEVQPDGKARVFLNGSLVASPALLVRTGSGDWRVMLKGASVETELVVRNVSVWEGLLTGADGN
jgi:hypothetical protein